MLADVPRVEAPAVAFIGDVHGWWSRLEPLLERIETWPGPGPAPFPVLVGDLVDRGPDSARVLAEVHQRCSAGRAACLLGNHEFALVRGLGVAERGILPVPEILDAWWAIYGGEATCASFGVGVGDAEGLRTALGPLLLWLTDLPWLLAGTCGTQPWLAVHAGLGPGDLAIQVAALSGAGRWLGDGGLLPAALYSKGRTRTRPHDLAPAVLLVSGHTPQPRARVEAGRILCDTTGGKPGRSLSAVVVPGGEVLTAP